MKILLTYDELNEAIQLWVNNKFKPPMNVDEVLHSDDNLITIEIHEVIKNDNG